MRVVAPGEEEEEPCKEEEQTALFKGPIRTAL